MNLFVRIQRFCVRYVIAFAMIGCVLLLPACAAPTVSPSDENGGTSPTPVPIVYSEGLAYERYVSSESLLDSILQGLPALSNTPMCMITGIGTCTDTNIVIPPMINGMRVIGIADRAFVKNEKENNQPIAHNVSSDFITLSATRNEICEDESNTVDIESVVIPSSVVTIGEEAFMGCEELSDVATPNLIQLIGKDAFKDTAYYNDPANWDGDVLYLENYLVSVKQTVSGNVIVKDGTTVIADKAFYNCTGLVGIQFPSTIVEIGAYAFYGCTSLLSVDLNCRELYVSESAFENCTSLHTAKIGFNEELYYPGMPGVEQNYEIIRIDEETIMKIPLDYDENGRFYVYPCRIRYHAFSGCSALKNVELRKTVSFIGGGVFSNCSSLESIKLPDTVTSLNMGVIFKECESLKSVTFGKYLTSIGAQTFYKCPSLTELYIPDGVTTVSDVAWFSGVKKLRLGANVTSLTWTQNNLEYVEFGGTMEQWNALTSQNLVFLAGTHTIVCSDGTISKVEQPPIEETKEIYDTITPHIYNTQVNSGAPENYTSYFNHDTFGGEEHSVKTMVTEEGFHQIITAFDGEVWELRGVVDGDNLTVYTKRDGKWYLSSAMMYGYSSSPYEWELPFGVFIRDEETNLYSYEVSEINAVLSVGFRDNKLVFSSLTTDDFEQITKFYDFGVTKLPEFSTSDVIEGIILDANGDVVS